MANKRKTYIDICRCLAIYLVVLGHTISNVRDQTYHILYSFHMPLFFIISGMVLKQRGGPTLKVKNLFQTILKRLYAYYIPYLIWGFLYSAISLKKFSPDIIGNLLYGSRESLAKIKSLTSLWFLAALLVASIICETILWLLNLSKYPNLWVAVSMVICFVIGFMIPHKSPLGWPMEVDIAFIASGFMLFGFLLKEMIENIKGKPVILWTSFIILLALTVFVLLRVVPNQKNMLMYKAVYGNVGPFFLDALVLSLFVISIALLLDQYAGRICEPLIFTGQNTMGILVLHKPLVQYLAKQTPKIGIQQLTLPVYCLVALTGLLISLGGSVLIGKIAPFLLGKHRSV